MQIDGSSDVARQLFELICWRPDTGLPRSEGAVTRPTLRRSGRESWLFQGSDRGGLRTAAMYTVIATTTLNDVEPQAWLADSLGLVAETP